MLCRKRPSSCQLMTRARVASSPQDKLELGLVGAPLLLRAGGQGPLPAPEPPTGCCSSTLEGAASFGRRRQHGVMTACGPRRPAPGSGVASQRAEHRGLGRAASARRGCGQRAWRAQDHLLGAAGVRAPPGRGQEPRRVAQATHDVVAERQAFVKQLFFSLFAALEVVSKVPEPPKPQELALAAELNAQEEAAARSRRKRRRRGEARGRGQRGRGRQQRRRGRAAGARPGTRQGQAARRRSQGQREEEGVQQQGRGAPSRRRRTASGVLRRCKPVRGFVAVPAGE
jgi:hypothetical protein